MLYMVDLPSIVQNQDLRPPVVEVKVVFVIICRIPSSMDGREVAYYFGPVTLSKQIDCPVVDFGDWGRTKKPSGHRSE